MDQNDLHQRLPAVVDRIVQSIQADERTRHLNRVLLPSRDEVVSAVGLLRELAFPGYFGKQGLTSANLSYHAGELINGLSDLLYHQVRHSLRYLKQLPGANGDDVNCRECDQHAAETVAAFLDRIPAVRELLGADVQAAFDGDPAARNTDETIFCYPGLFAIFVQRMAHELFALDVPLLPRIMTEHALSLTGIDIHPGA